MGRRWRRRSRPQIKEVVVSPKEFARRKAVALERNAELADIRIPRIQVEIAEQMAVIERFANSRGVSMSEVQALREQLPSRQRERMRKADEENRSDQQRIRDAKHEIDIITESDRQANGILRRIFFGYRPSLDAANQIAQHRNVIQEAERAVRERTELLRKYHDEEKAFLMAFDLIPALEEVIRQHERNKKKLLRVKEVEQQRKEKAGLKDAIVAAFLNRTRDLADNIKKQLIDQAVQCPYCPYCGGDYGEEPHADHIYPVSRGGLSTLANMVLVCNGCNLRKSAKTLREFLLLHQLDRSFIEANLERLGKEF